MNTSAINRMVKASWKPLAGAIGLGAMLAHSGGACHPKLPPGRVEFAPGRPLPADSALHAVRREPYAPRLELVGTVASEEKINLSARIPAHVKEVRVSAGQAVKTGQVLLVLDDREVREQLAAAEAQFRQAETEYQRAKQLFESKATTEQALTAAESLHAAARAQVERVKVMLSYAQIASPIDGMVTDRRVEAGDLANPGQLLLAVYDPRRLWLEVPVPVRLIERVSLGQTLEMKLDRPARVMKGAVAEILGEIDPRSRTQMAKVRLEDPAGVLPGTFGRLWLSGEERPALRVPESAVFAIGQLEFVQVVRDGRAVRRIVRTGPREDGRVEILSGLADGDQVVVHPSREG